MGGLAADLGIGRATLYRWLGDRQQLIDELLGKQTAIAWEQVAASAEGSGLERVLEVAARFITHSAAFGPVRDFARREPDLALRVLLDPQGGVARNLRAGVLTELSRAAPQYDVDTRMIDIAVGVATALEWSHVVAGYDPQVEAAVETMRVLITAAVRERTDAQEA